MKGQTTVVQIETVAEFLIHALELEHESRERYAQLADSMEVHHNEEVEQLFRRLAEMSEEHADQVEARAAGIPLPEIAPGTSSGIAPEVRKAIAWNTPSIT